MKKNKKNTGAKIKERIVKKNAKTLGGKKSALKKTVKPRGTSQRTPINPSRARVEIRRLLIALNRTNQRDKVGLANLRDEVNDFADKLRRSSPDAYTEFELEIKLIYERVFNKLTGEHVFVE
ncbi:hypothetical protein HY992_05100 [Candidatus Micrarchaeota archaeon]|nr:hypothetical protein [Candidatus Micrarchaeota archaeon]